MKKSILMMALALMSVSLGAKDPHRGFGWDNEALATIEKNYLAIVEQVGEQADVAHRLQGYVTALSGVVAHEGVGSMQRLQVARAVQDEILARLEKEEHAFALVEEGEAVSSQLAALKVVHHALEHLTLMRESDLKRAQAVLTQLLHGNVVLPGTGSGDEREAPLEMTPEVINNLDTPVDDPVQLLATIEALRKQVTQVGQQLDAERQAHKETQDETTESAQQWRARERELRQQKKELQAKRNTFRDILLIGGPVLGAITLISAIAAIVSWRAVNKSRALKAALAFHGMKFAGGVASIPQSKAKDNNKIRTLRSAKFILNSGAWSRAFSARAC